MRVCGWRLLPLFPPTLVTLSSLLILIACGGGGGGGGCGGDGVGILGAFRAAKEFCLNGGQNPQAIVIGQFNSTNDSKLDVAVADEDTGDVSILQGDGMGGLGSPTTFSTSGSDPVALATGSFNLLDDSFTDIAAVNSLSDDVAILLGDGAGSFNAASPETVATDLAPKSVAVGDFDGINGDDLAVANYDNGTDGNVTILLSNGDGTFTEAPSSPIALNGSGPWAIAAGKIDGGAGTDYLDLVVSDLTGDAIWVFLGNGDGTFQTSGISPVIIPLPFGTGPAAVVIDDFDGDTFADLAVVNQGTAGESCTSPIGSRDTITILFGLGDGGFPTQVTYPVGSNPRAIALGDFNKDGVQDLVTANYCSNDISVLMGVGDGTFQPAVSYAVDPSGTPGLQLPTGVAVGDLDNDGFDDIAVSNSSSDGLSDSVSVLLNNN
jgi:FG-GAP-like repeat